MGFGGHIPALNSPGDDKQPTHRFIFEGKCLEERGRKPSVISYRAGTNVNFRSRLPRKCKPKPQSDIDNNDKEDNNDSGGDSDASDASECSENDVSLRSTEQIVRIQLEKEISERKVKEMDMADASKVSNDNREIRSGKGRAMVLAIGNYVEELLKNTKR